MTNSLVKNDSRFFPVLKNIIRVETAITRFPLHHLAKNAGEEEISIEETYFEDEIEKKTIWKVRHRPGPLAYKVETLVINRRIDETGRPVPKILPLGSLREIGKMASLGTNTEKVKEALRQNAFAAITAKFRYTTKNNKKKYVESNFTRYKIVFAGEELPDKTSADQVFIIFDDDYLSILNTAQNRPLDYDFLALLPPMAQRFYELISFHMYAALHNRQPTARMLYSDFCKYAPQTRQATYEAMTKQMYKVHRHHLDQGYIKKVSYLSNRTTPADWWMIYEPGERAEREYEYSQGNYVLPTGGETPIAPPVPVLLSEEINQTGNLSVEEAELFKELKVQGLQDKVAFELIQSYPERVREQLDALPHRNIKKTTSGYLIKAIRENYALPTPLFNDLLSTNNQLNSNSLAGEENSKNQVFQQIDSVIHKFKELIRKYPHLQLETIGHKILKSLDSIKDDINSSNQVELQEVENKLVKLEDKINNSLLKLADEIDKINAQDEIKNFRHKFNSEQFQQMYETSLLKTLRKKYDVPRISLYLNE